MKPIIYNFKCWIKETEPEELKRGIRDLLKEAGFDIIKSAYHNFEPQGFTAAWIIAESHCAIHTWPEENTTYIELSSCNLEKYEEFIDLLMERYDLMFNQPARIIGGMDLEELDK